MEGALSASWPGFEFERYVAISEMQYAYKVCALSSTYDSTLLWGYYAEGFAGVVVEVDLPDESGVSVDYPKKPENEDASYNAYTEVDWKKSDDENVRKILSTKRIEWQHEREVRVLQAKGDYFDAPVTKLIIGYKAFRNWKSLLSNDKPADTEKTYILREVCRQKKVDVSWARPNFFTKREPKIELFPCG